jgi:hypothetical protein
LDNLASTLRFGANSAETDSFIGFIAFIKVGNNQNANTNTRNVYGDCGIEDFPTNTGCFDCPTDCQDGCANTSICLPDICTDPLCTSCPSSFEQCNTCMEYSYLIQSIGVCSCVANSSYNKATNSCKCNFGYEPNIGACILCKDYLLPTNIIEAAYNSDYSSITISLNREVDRTYINSCSDIFSTDTYQQIGSMATCIVSADNQSIVITLGSNSSFTSGTLNLNVLSLIGNQNTCITNPSALSVDVPLGSNPPTPTAVINTSTLFSISCSDNPLLLRGDKSTYNPRFGITYDWSLSGTAVTQALTTYLNTKKTEIELTLDPNLLQAGTLTVTLEVSNSLSVKNSETKSVRIVGTRYLGVSLDPGTTTTIISSNSLEISTIITDRCDTTGTLTYDWSYISSTNQDFTSSVLTEIETNSKYTIPAGKLPGGYNYEFTVTVTESTGITGTNTITITVLNPPLVASVNRSSGAVTSNQDLTITSTSTDPAQKGLNYSWSCTTLNAACEDASNNQLTFGNTQSITIVQQDLVDYQDYTITLTISSQFDSRTASTSVYLRTIDSTPAAIFLESPVRPAVNDPIYVYPIIEAPDDAQYEWLNRKETNATPIIGSTPALVFTENTLTKGTEYHYELTVKNSAGVLLSSGTLLFTTNDGPICTGFTIAPSTGIEFSTDFTIKALGCVDGDNLDIPLSYQYNFKTASNGVFLLKVSSSSDTYITKLNRNIKYVTVTVCDSKGTCITSDTTNPAYPLSVTVTKAPAGTRMLSSDMLELYNQLLEYPENLPAATILITTSDLLDKETYNTIKTAFDNYIKSVQSTKFTRELALSIYKAFILYQSEILDNNEILSMLQVCYELVKQDNQITHEEAYGIYENFYPTLSTRGDDHFFVANSLELLKKIFLASLNNSPPTVLDTRSISGDHFYQRLLGYNLNGLSLPLENLNFTLPNSLETNTIYDLFVEAVQTEDLPIFTAYLAEVGIYNKLNVALYSSSSLIKASDSISYQFEVPYFGSNDDLAVKCQIYSEGSGVWEDANCNGKIKHNKVKVISNKLGTYRLMLVEASEIVSESLSECEMNPAPYAVVCVWFGLVILLFIFCNLFESSKPTLYNQVNHGLETHKTNRFTGFEKDVASPRINVEQIQAPTPSSSFFSKHILVSLFKTSDPVERINKIVSLLTSMFLGFAILGAFNYHYGDVEDNSESSMTDIVSDYYPGDMKSVFITLALVTPAILPFRLMSKFNNIGRSLTSAFTVLTLIGSIVGVLTMGALFCQGAAMRWTLSYLIYIPLELAITEFIVATVVHVAGRN